MHGQLYLGAPPPTGLVVPFVDELGPRAPARFGDEAPNPPSSDCCLLLEGEALLERTACRCAPWSADNAHEWALESRHASIHRFQAAIQRSWNSAVILELRRDPVDIIAKVEKSHFDHVANRERRDI